jgi:hypothetical protein
MRHYKYKDKRSASDNTIRTASDLSTIQFDIRISDLLTIQFRLSFKDKGHKSLEYYCLVIHLTSVISTISYPQSNGDIFIVIAP